MGLALSGQPGAGRALAEIIAAPGADPRIVAHANEALALHGRILREGPEAILRNHLGSDG